MNTTVQSSLAETYASEALGIAWPAGASPHYIGRNLIIECNARRGWYKRGVPYESLPQAPSHRGHGLSIVWRRLPSETERVYPGAHAFDRSGDYLAAAGAAMLPWGAPEWRDMPCLPLTHEPGKAMRAGLWHVTVDYAGSPWNGYELPAVCPEGDSVWLWTPSARAALACGYRLRSNDGAILWSEQHPLLRTWAGHVWDARRALETHESNAGAPGGVTEVDYWPLDSARRDAIALVKRVYVQTIGKFGDLATSERLEDEGYERTAPAWYRPEWFCTIHAEALAYSSAVMRRAVSVGYPPLWARIDTLGFAGPDDRSAGALAFDAGIFMKPGQLGAWRYDYSLPMAELLDPRGHTVHGSDGKAHRLPGVKG